MSQNTLNKLIILALLLSIAADFIFLFAEIGRQKRNAKKEKCEKTSKIEIQELQREFELLKLIIKESHSL